MSIANVSLSTARLLKENGFRQDTENFWFENELRISKNSDNWNYPKVDWSRYAAPTTDEILSELPASIKGNDFFVDRFHNQWLFGYYDLCEDDKNYYSTPVEALANLWLWIKKEGLL